MVVTGNPTALNSDSETKCIVNPSTVYISWQALLNANCLNSVIFISSICKLFVAVACDDRVERLSEIKVPATAR